MLVVKWHFQFVLHRTTHIYANAVVLHEALLNNCYEMLFSASWGGVFFCDMRDLGFFDEKLHIRLFYTIGETWFTCAIRSFLNSI